MTITHPGTPYAQAGFAAVATGFRLIAASAYLRSIALFVVSWHTD